MDREAVVGAEPAHVADAAVHQQSFRMGFIRTTSRQFGSGDLKNQHLQAVLTASLQDGGNPDEMSGQVFWLSTWTVFI